MEEKLIIFETAKLAKEIGFDQKIRPTYWTDGNLTNTTNGDVRHLYSSAPTQALLQKWLREVKYISALVYLDAELNHYYVINSIDERCTFQGHIVGASRYSNDYERCLADALKLAIKKLKQPWTC